MARITTNMEAVVTPAAEQRRGVSYSYLAFMASLLGGASIASAAWRFLPDWPPYPIERGTATQNDRPVPVGNCKIGAPALQLEWGRGSHERTAHGAAVKGAGRRQGGAECAVRGRLPGTAAPSPCPAARRGPQHGAGDHRAGQRVLSALRADRRTEDRGPQGLLRLRLAGDALGDRGQRPQAAGGAARRRCAAGDAVHGTGAEPGPRGGSNRSGARGVGAAREGGSTGGPGGRDAFFRRLQRQGDRRSAGC